MKIDKHQRAAARHKKTEAVDSILNTQKDEPVHSHQEDNKTLWRSGVVVRNDKNVGHDALQRARGVIESVASTKKERIKTVRLAGREWFEKNRAGVERTIGESIRLDKRQFLGKGMEIENKQENPQYPRDDLSGYQNMDMDMDQYRPQIDDDAEVYVPMSER